MSAPRRTPREARTGLQVCELPRDNVGTRDYWILVNVGEVYISRRAFDRFVDWYNTGRFTKPAKRRSATKPDKRRGAKSRARSATP